MAEEDEWLRVMKELGHLPRMEEEDPTRLDIWVCDQGYHNGPGCETCGDSWCHHCLKPHDIKACTNPVIETTAVEPLLMIGTCDVP